MGTLTPQLLLSKPTPGGTETNNVWGSDLNANFDKIDAWTGPLPSRIAALEAGGVGGATDWNSITGKPSTFPPSAHTHPELAPLNNPHFTGTEAVTDGDFWTKNGGIYGGPAGLDWISIDNAGGWIFSGGLWANSGASEVWHAGNYGHKTISTVAPTTPQGVDGDVWYQVAP